MMCRYSMQLLRKVALSCSKYLCVRVAGGYRGKLSIILGSVAFPVKCFGSLALTRSPPIVFLVVFKGSMCEGMFDAEFCLDLLGGCLKAGYADLSLSALIKAFEAPYHFNTSFHLRLRRTQTGPEGMGGSCAAFRGVC